MRKKREDKKSELSEIKRRPNKNTCVKDGPKKSFQKRNMTKRQANRLQNTTTTYEIKD